MGKIIIPETYKYIAAFLTMRCNLNCSFCLNAFDKSFTRAGFKEISGKKWVEALNKIQPTDIPITFSGGEPFLHPDFIEIINALRPEHKIDILTNLHWGKQGINRFIKEVNPERVKRDSPYASIRVSYHPDQMEAEKLIADVKKLQDAGFSIGIWAVLYPSPAQLSSLTEMQFRCLDAGIAFRVKDYTGEYKGEIYGNYSRYHGSAFSNKLKNCLCKTSDLIIGPDGKVYRCHRDLYAEEFSIGSILDSEFQIEPKYRECSKYGLCHPCDVKVKTDSKQKIQQTSVEIKDVL